MIDEEGRGIEQLICRHIFGQRFFAVIVSSSRKVSAPLRHGFIHRREFASHSALGMALAAGVFEEMTSFGFAAFLGCSKSREQA